MEGHGLAGGMDDPQVADWMNPVVDSGVRIERMKFTLRNSPVNEVILGVQFERPAFTASQQIEIYERFKEDYPTVEEVPPLPSTIESLDAPPSQRILSKFVSRKHFVSRDQHRVIQVQSDRVLFNWRRTEKRDEYPAYEVVFGAFAKIIDAVAEFVGDDVGYNQYEFTYVDHILLGPFELDAFDVGKILRLLNESVPYKNITLDYSIPYSRIGGVLNASLKSATRKDTKDRLLVLESTCRGFVQHEPMTEWFSKAHDILLSHFSSIMTAKAKSVWGFQEG